MSAAGQWRGGLCVPEVRYAGGEGGGVSRHLGGPGPSPSASHYYFRLGTVTQGRDDAAGSRST